MGPKRIAVRTSRSSAARTPEPTSLSAVGIEPSSHTGEIFSRAAVAAAVGLCAGTALAESVGALPLLVALAVAAAAVARRNGSPVVWLLTIAALSGLIGSWRMQGALTAEASGMANVQRLAGSEQVRGLVSDEPSPRGRATSLRLTDVVVRQEESWQPLGANVVVTVPRATDHQFGEYLQLRGRLQPLSGGGAVQALNRQGYLATMAYPQVSYLANPQANPILIGLAYLREELAASIDRTLPDPSAAILKATVLGVRGALPKDETQALVDTGTVHLVAISGFKLTIIASALELAGLWLLRRIGAGAATRAAVATWVIGGIAGYTLLTGSTPSAVRAAIMAGLVALAALAGRPRDQLAALSLAVLAIVGLRPLELYDGGLQLSTLSVLGITLLAQPLAARMTVLERAPAVAEALATSIAATAFVLPVLAASFHTVSLVSPLANLLGMPLLGPIMAFGGLGAAAGAIWQPLGAVLLWPAWAFTTLLDHLVRFAAALPYAALAVEGMPLATIAVYYGLLLAATAWLNRTRAAHPQQPSANTKLRWAGVAAAGIGLVAATALTTRPKGQLTASLLAVPGQAALIQTADGKKVLVDGGQNGPDTLRQLGLLLAPWDRSVDLVVVSSATADHVGGLGDVFARYSVARMIEPDVEQPSVAYRRLQSNAERVAVDDVDLGGGALLSRVPNGWRLSNGGSTLLILANGFEADTPDGAWRIDRATLSDSGTLTLSLG